MTLSQHAKRPRVLIAEDHPGVAKAVCRLLALDCDVVGNVADGRAVLEAAQRLQPDVVVVDLNLPTSTDLRSVVRSQQTEPRSESHRVLGDERSGHQATILRGRSIGLCVQRGAGDLLSTVKRLCDDRR